MGAIVIRMRYDEGTESAEVATSDFMSHEGKYCTFNKILVRKAQISVEN